MAAQTTLIEKKADLRMRRKRLFGLNDSILSNTTVYLNTYTEESSHLSAEDMAMYAAVAKYFDECDS